MNDLYGGENWFHVVMVTGVIGGGAALLAGRAISATWRPFWYVIAYMFLLAAGVRFLHFALFAGYILSIPSYLADALFLIAVGSLAYRLTRVRHMTRQYPWLYDRTSPFSWREKGGDA